MFRSYLGLEKKRESSGCLQIIMENKISFTLRLKDNLNEVRQKTIDGNWNKHDYSNFPYY